LVAWYHLESSQNNVPASVKQQFYGLYGVTSHEAGEYWTEPSGTTSPQSSQWYTLRFFLKTTFSEAHLGQTIPDSLAAPFGDEDRLR
jgi:hypothetical protein